MHNYLIKKGTTDVSVELRIVDSTDGTPETGVVWNTAGIDLQYRRDGAASTAITEATLAALTTAHTDGGFLHIGNGIYRFDLPDAACASGVDKVVVHGTVTGMVVIGCVIQLTDVDMFDGVRAGLTALPNAAADAAGGLPISDAGGLDLDAKVGALTFTVANEVDSNVITKTGFSLAATGLDAIASTATGMVEIAKAIWDRVLSKANHDIAQSAGKRVRQVDAAFEVHSGIAQAGTATAITLDTGASATDNIYRGDRVIITAGTGAGEHDICIAYNGTTKVATVAETWVVTPDATSEFVLVPASVDIETWQHNVVTGNGDWAAAQADLDTITGTNGVLIDDTESSDLVDLIYNEDMTSHQTINTAGRYHTLAAAILNETTATGTPTSTTIQLTAGSAVDDFYNDQLLYVTSGTGVGQVRVISDYVGATKTCTVDEAFSTTPVAADGLIVRADHVHSITSIQSGLATEAKQDVIDANVDLILADTADMQPKLGTPAGADMSADIAAIKADTAAILIDTNELQVDWTNGGRLDLIIDAINTATATVTLSAAERNAIADAMLDRDMSTGTDSGSTTVRTMRQSLRSGRNKVTIAGGTMTVYKEDDATASWTAAITTTAGDPISDMNPAGGS